MSKQRSTPAELPENSTAFNGILGYDGYIQTQGTIWQRRIYFAVTENGTFPIAESFGFDGPQDYDLDLDGSGGEELAANVQYGGDGHRDVFVYQRRGDTIWKGVLDLSDLPNHDNWGVNSTTAEYDPAAKLFRVRYTQKGTKTPGLLETRGLRRFRFSPYEYEP